MGSSKLQPPGSPPESSTERLDSWKEIAAYLKRDERTVRRWEAEGMPVHRQVHKKQASVYAYRTEIDAWRRNGKRRLDESQSAPFPQWLVPWIRGDSRRVPWAIPVAGLVLIGLVVVGTLYWTRNSRERWARNQALPEIVRLIDEGKTDQAFQLALRAKRYIPNDPVLLRTLRAFTKPISIRTTPGGADVYVRTYSASEKDWTFLGRSPLEDVLVPWDYLSED